MRRAYRGNKDYFKESGHGCMSITHAIQRKSCNCNKQQIWTLGIRGHARQQSPLLPPLGSCSSCCCVPSWHAALTQSFQQGRKFAQANSCHRYWLLLLLMCKTYLGSREILFRYFFSVGLLIDVWPSTWFTQEAEKSPLWFWSPLFRAAFSKWPKCNWFEAYLFILLQVSSKIFGGLVVPTEKKKIIWW